MFSNQALDFKVTFKVIYKFTPHTGYEKSNIQICKIKIRWLQKDETGRSIIWIRKREKSSKNPVRTLPISSSCYFLLSIPHSPRRWKPPGHAAYNKGRYGRHPPLLYTVTAPRAF